MTPLLHIPSLLRMARATISDPRTGARFVIGLNLPRPVLWQFFLLQLVLSAILKIVVFDLMPADGDIFPEEAAITFTMLEAVVGLAMILGMTYIGRALGGTGDFNGSLALVIWLQFVLLLVSVLQIILLVVMPPMVDLLSVAAIGLFFWLLVGFVAELHGFKSTGTVFLGVILSIFAIFILLSILLTMLGFQPV